MLERRPLSLAGLAIGIAAVALRFASHFVLKEARYTILVRDFANSISTRADAAAAASRSAV